MPRPPSAASALACAAQDPTTDPTATALRPSDVELLLRIKGDLRLGLPVILRDGGDSLLVAPVETLTEARYRAMTALGVADLAMTGHRARALGAESRTPVPLRVRVPPGSTLAWLAALSGQDPSGAGTDTDPNLTAALPPLETATPAQAAAIALATAARIVPALLTVSVDADASHAGLMTMPVQALTTALARETAQAHISHARLPMAACEAGRVHVFRADDGDAEHYAIEIGTIDRAGPVTVRLHSACFTGDVLGSLKCDCGAQLRAAMAAMAERGGGVLLYLGQEGRGIGLANKMRAYALQDAGLDTVDANHWLGFDDDHRDFRIGAQILRRMGIDRVRLMTNNIAKQEVLSRHGIEVLEQVPLRVGRTAHNADYLATKAAKSGHLL